MAGGWQLEYGMSGASRTGNGEIQLTVESPTLRGRHGFAVGLLGALALTAFAAGPADARHAARHAEHSDSGKHTEHTASAGPPYAAIVVDANTGAVLHAANPDEPRHPASLTKIMTLYLLFERLDAGKLRLDTPLAVSEHASDQAPTKLGLKPDQTIAVEDAIRGLVTKSANDAAVVIAEAIGGDEHDFAEMMTHKAHALGMSRTVYRNASGLPNDEQITTARDQALLGRLIQERFPRYYTYFATPSFTYHGMSMRNHNQLLGRVEGVDGIKTGYTQASGYNLVASVRRNNRHIVSVVLGGASAGARDARMRSLIEQYIVVASTQKNATAIAEAASAKDTRTADARPSETHQAAEPIEPQAAESRATEPRAAEPGAGKARPGVRPNPAAVYAVASYTKPIPWPQTAASAAGASAASPQPADATAAVPAQPARPANPGVEPIKPIAVKTVKVKLPQTQIAALAPQTAPPPVEEAPAPPAPQPAAPLQRPAAAAVMPLPDLTPFESRRDVVRDPVREIATPPVPPAPPIRTATAPTAPPVSAPVTSAPVHNAPPRTAAAHLGWIIQVGAYEAEQEAKQKLSTVQAKAASLLGRADPYTEPVVKGDTTLYRARFAGLQKEEAEAICRQLKRNDIDCMTVKN